MKAKVVRGSGFRGALEYVMGDGKKPEIVGGNMTGGTPRELAAEFAAARRLRTDVKRPVWHCALALPAGERLDDDQWRTIAADFMTEMGFTDATQYIAVRHNDTDHDHIHIVTSRIGLDGNLWLGQWEARKAIEATAALEQRHGLTLTPTLGEDRAEKKALTTGEINKAARTGEEPPRQQLQRLIDEAAKNNPTAVDFAERLEMAGVVVIPNIAKTGLLNGFSFELAGEHYKGSQLGSRYSWKGLQKHGVQYDKNRDSAELEQRRAAAKDNRSIDGPTADDAEPAGRNSNTNIAEPAPARDITAGSEHGTGSIRPDLSNATRDARRTNDRDDETDRAKIQNDSSSAGETGPAITEHNRSTTDRDAGLQSIDDRAETTAGRDDSSIQNGGGHSRGIERGSGPLEAERVENANNTGHSSGDRQRSSTGWAERFKRASAAKRGNAGNAKKRSGVGADSMDTRNTSTADRVKTARQIDPARWLEAAGYEVKREGRHVTVTQGGDEVYRGTEKDGRWIWCDHYSNGIGDNIDLARDITGAGFTEALYQIAGAPSVAPRQRPTVQQTRTPPRIPANCTVNETRGREYLRKQRDITDETIHAAETSGMLRYCDDGVMFAGYDDDGTVQNATRRAIDPRDAVQKRDFKGSSKYYPPVLPGKPTSVWIVEGGTDALALHDIAKRQGQQPPTVIVSGGANVRSFFNNQTIRELLTAADKIVIAAEHEKDAETQKKTDAAHEEQARIAKSITGTATVTVWKPAGGKDLADHNSAALHKPQHVTQKEPEQEHTESEPEKQQHRSRLRL